MKIIIAGSRSLDELSYVYQAVEDSPFKGKITEVVSGKASKGVDRRGEQWARIEGLPIKPFPAQWNLYGKSAGAIRNREMGDYANGLIAIWDGVSNGTMDMINYMKSLKKPVSVFVVGPGGTVTVTIEKEQPR